MTIVGELEHKRKTKVWLQMFLMGKGPFLTSVPVPILWQHIYWLLWNTRNVVSISSNQLGHKRHSQYVDHIHFDGRKKKKRTKWREIPSDSECRFWHPSACHWCIIKILLLIRRRIVSWYSVIHSWEMVRC